MNDMDVKTVDERKSRSMNDYLECIVKFQNGMEVGYREELVRCKYCIKRKTNSCLMYWNGIFDDETQDDNWYCPDGERKDS